MADAVLAQSGIAVQAFAAMTDLAAELPRGAGALLVAEEVLTPPARAQLTTALAAQPPWSDIPVLILARPGADSPLIADVMAQLPNVTVIERPVRVAALVSALRTALRARTRQYELRALLDGLHQADRRKTEFLATLAHELRNPLAPISTALSLLAHPLATADDSQRQHEVMRRQVDHMVRLVDDLLEVSRITRGKVDLQRLPVPLDAAIRDAVELSRPLIDAAKHTLQVTMPDDALIVDGDLVRLTQVFSNLLNNAAKYTPAGGRVAIDARPDGADALVEVVDSGVGLDEDMLEPIFDMFVQVGGAARAAQGGLGIGLTLVKSLVELHGGQVSARSEGRNRGSTFSVRLPLSRQAGQVAAAEHAPAWEAASVPHSILVVDDNRDAADSLAELLRALGATAFAAYSGAQALQLAAERRLDAAVLDIGMPGMDGCDLARRLRGSPAHSAMLLIALTGWGQEADKQRINEAGFDHHMLKPADAAALIGVLQAHPRNGG
ncbi:hybrid sensor histidine kinase/response regulator [Aquabacterium humicola]|uniref:hybrid sensor histidine kinase/response regulator n=1 Tax=Aquabacterium humicola TaxID=3237377 RepID=UPI002543B985|nr:ATP-binding protein [Rubrivivax pictus]